jgi:hypothetical protein
VSDKGGREGDEDGDGDPDEGLGPVDVTAEVRMTTADSAITAAKVEIRCAMESPR